MAGQVTWVWWPSLVNQLLPQARTRHASGCILVTSGVYTTPANLPSGKLTMRIHTPPKLGIFCQQNTLPKMSPSRTFYENTSTH